MDEWRICSYSIYSAFAIMITMLMLKIFGVWYQHMVGTLQYYSQNMVQYYNMVILYSKKLTLY